MLLLGSPSKAFISDLEDSGFHVTTATSAKQHVGKGFDLCLSLRQVERGSDPLEELGYCYEALRVGGTMAFVTAPLRFEAPSFSSGEWFRFSERTLQTALFCTHFHEVVVAHHSIGGFSLTFSRAASSTERRLLSIVVPAFNEASSLAELMDAVLAKEIEGIDLEIILIESNSTDGTREIALRYGDHPRVSLILEDRPRGKGHAVRTGLQKAKGDFILIQDADLEYDLEDYEALLEPLISGHEAFVLGSRHSGSVWKMRRFSGQAFLSGFLNAGHWIFTTLVNLLFHQQLKDPFTMYKVFRRDCLFGLRFDRNRFDFDYELLVKLILKGYQPREIPVNYRSRSFKQGKKVSMFRDPLTWLWALAKLKFAKVDPLAEVQIFNQQRNSPTCGNERCLTARQSFTATA